MVVFCWGNRNWNYQLDVAVVTASCSKVKTMSFQIYFGLLVSLGFFSNCFCQEGESIVNDRAILTAIRETEVASEAPGIVQMIRVIPGEDVTKNQVLVKLNRDIFGAEYEVAKSELQISILESQNDVDLRYAKKSYQVNEALLSRSKNARRLHAKSVSKTEIERLELEVEQAQLSTEQAVLESEIASSRMRLQRKRKEIARINLSNRDIGAPFSGRVEELSVQLGQWVNAGQKIARLSDYSKMRAKAYFDSRWIFRIKKGNSANFEMNVGGREIVVVGKVSFVGSEVDVGSRFAVWVDLDNSNSDLIAGMRGILTIELQPEIPSHTSSSDND